MNTTFKKEERLSSQKIIGELFDKGSSFAFHPLRFVWLPATLPTTKYPAQVAISVSKKRFKHAVDRNRIKRLIREAYRLAKEEHLYLPLRATEGSMALMIIYTGNTIFTAEEAKTKLNSGLLRLVEKYGKSASGNLVNPDQNL